MNNDIITSFIRMDNSEKLKYVEDYYYMPDYVEKVDKLSNELLLLAKEKKAGKTIAREDSCVIILFSLINCEWMESIHMLKRRLMEKN